MSIKLKNKNLITEKTPRSLIRPGELLLILMLIIPPIELPSAKADSALNFDPFISTGAPNRPAGDDLTGSDSTVIPQINFNNNNISMAFQIISDAAGWSIFPTAQVSNAKISLWAKNITAKELLDTVVTMAGFIYHRQRNLFTVMTYDEYVQYYGLAKKVLSFEYADAAAVNTAIKPFLSKLGVTVVHKQTNKILIYDTDANLKFITPILKKLDTPSENITIQVIKLTYADSKGLAKILQTAFAIRQRRTPVAKSESAQKNKTTAQTQKSLPNNKKGTSKAPVFSKNKLTAPLPGKTPQTPLVHLQRITIPQNQIGIYPLTHANQLLVVGTESDIKKVKSILKKIDVPGQHAALDVITLKYADAKIVSQTLSQLFSQKQSKNMDQSPPLAGENLPSLKTAKQKRNKTNTPLVGENILQNPESEVKIFSIDRTNQLLIKAAPSDLEPIKKLVKKLDTYIEPVTKNYQFTYVDASEIYNGLHQVLNIKRSSTPTTSAGPTSSGNGKMEGIMLIKNTNSILLTAPPAAHRIMTTIVGNIDLPGRYKGGVIKIYKLDNADVQEVAAIVKEMLRKEKQQTPQTTEMKYAHQENQQQMQTEGAPKTGKTTEFISQVEAKVAVSKSKNSIIVQATEKEHHELGKLIEELDKRRRQVLIEAKIIEFTNTDNLNLGVELSHSSRDISSFTSFGLSSNLDPTTGVRNITVSPGGTAAVLRPDKLQAILQALKTKGNARITSAPQILVNNNAIGTINSIAEEPTTQTNQGETTTTTSFAGFVQAGTQFAITPHISEHDYLRVQYQITLNSFGTKPTDPSIPPPRNTSSIQSEATIPDGYTIVVGGLQTTDESKNVDKVPVLGDIPLLEWVFKNTSIEKKYKTTYLFITPTIIKSENFSDLKDASNNASKKAKRNSNIFPKSQKIKE